MSEVVYGPRPAERQRRRRRRADRGRRGRGRGGARGVAGRGPVVDAAPAQPPLLRAGARRRALRRRLPRARRRRRAAGSRRGRKRGIRRAPHPLLLLLRRRRLAARRARPRRRRARPRGAGADRPRRALGRDGVRAGLQAPRRPPDHGDGADGETRGAWRQSARHLSRHPARADRRGLSQPLPARDRRPRGDAAEARPRAPPPSVALEELEAHAEGVVCLSGCARQGAHEHADRLAAAFGRDRFRVELQRPFWRHDRARNRRLERIAERLGVPCVATGNVHMHDRSRARLQDALVAVRLGGTLEETEPRRRGNSSAWLRPPAETAAILFRDHPEAVAEAGRVAEAIEFDLTRDLGYRYPGSEDPGADHALAEICAGRLEHRYAGTPQLADARKRLDRGAAGDPGPEALGLLPPALRPARAGARDRRRGPRPGLSAMLSCRRGADGAPA